MRIVKNTSAWSGADLSRIIGHALIIGRLTLVKQRLLTIVVRGSSRKFTAHVQRVPMRMVLSIPKTTDVQWLRRELAATVVHEAWHLRGITAHGTMPEHIRYCHHEKHVDGEVVPLYRWADAMPLRERVARTQRAARPSTDARVAHMKAKCAEWNRKAEAARRRALKWERVLNAFERKLGR